MQEILTFESFGALPFNTFGSRRGRRFLGFDKSAPSQSAFDERLQQKSNRLDLSELAVRALGDQGRRRFESFRRYPDGWGGGKGKQLSTASVAMFERFVRRVPDIGKVRPSLFLTFQGNLQLGWKDKEQRDIEIEFTPNRWEYYLESRDAEGSVTIEGMISFIEIVKPLID